MRSTSMMFLSAALAMAAGAQTPPGVKLQRGVQAGGNVSVHLRDGSTIYGRMERQDADSVVVVSSAGRLAFGMTNVRELRDAGRARVGSDGKTEYWFPNANTTRLFFAPTGRMLPQGEGYFASHYVVLGSTAFGLTDYVTFGGGTFLIPSSKFWFVTPKVGLVRSERVNVAAGALIGVLGDESAGIGFAAATFGGNDRSATLAIGNGFSGGKFAKRQIVMLGAESRVSRRLSLVTENYLFPGVEDPVVSYGFRILGEKIALDLAFLNSLGSDAVFPGIPYVDFVIRW